MTSERVPGFEDECGYTPAIKRLIAEIGAIQEMHHYEEIAMVALGEEPKYKESYPHSLDCERRINAAASLVSQACEQLKLAKVGK